MWGTRRPHTAKPAPYLARRLGRNTALGQEACRWRDLPSELLSMGSRRSSTAPPTLGSRDFFRRARALSEPKAWQGQFSAELSMDGQVRTLYFVLRRQAKSVFLNRSYAC